MKYKDFLNELINDRKDVERKVNAAAGVIMKADENDRKQILLIQRSADDHWPHHWEFPRGKCDHGKTEDVIQCAKREIKEETGLKVRVVALIDTFQYLADRGKRLTTCYNYLCELDPEGQEVKLSKEHQDFKWISEVGEAEMLALPDQKKTIEKVLNGDRPMVNYTNNDFTKNNQIEENKMSIIDDYLEQIYLENHPLYEKVMVMVAEAKWRRKLELGKLGRGDLRRIQQHKSGPDPLHVKQLHKQGKHKEADKYVKKKGMVKSSRDWLAGVEKGTKNILKKHDAKVVHKPDKTFAGVAKTGAAAAGIKMKAVDDMKVGKTMKNPMSAHMTVRQGGKRTRVHVASGVKKKEQGANTFSKRHEADEVVSAKKQARRNKGVITPMRQDAGHMSSEVLDKERKLVRTAKSLYGKKAGTKELEKHRKQTGEYETLPKRKEYKKAEKKAEKEAIKQKADARKEFRSGSKEDQKAQKKEGMKQLKSMGMTKKDAKTAIKSMT